jgi:hypothetical protein
MLAQQGLLEMMVRLELQALLERMARQELLVLQG